MTELIITFRETLEASLIVGIVLAYLSQTNRQFYNKVVFLAVGLAGILSAILAFVFNSFLGGFSGRNEELFEGVIMITAAIMVSTVVIWMMKQSHGSAQIKKQVDFHLNKSQEIGLFGLVFLSVLREGIEVVLFLGAKSLTGVENLGMALLGMLLAIIIGLLIFKVGVKISLKPFFMFSSVFLILFGAGLFAHGVHELEEAGLVNPVVEHVWNLENTLSETRGVGLLLKDIFGYNANPSFTEVSAYIFYLNAIYLYYLLVSKKEHHYE